MTPHILTRLHRIFIAIITLIPFLCLNRVSAEEALTIQMDFDNTGTIDNSLEEKIQANCQETFGKFIPYNPRNPEYVEFRVTVPASSNTNTKRFLQLDLGSNEVSLWGNTLNDQKKLLSAPAMSNCTSKESKPSKQNNNTKWTDNILSLLDVNLDATEQNPIQDQDIKSSTENGKRPPYLIEIDNKAHTYTFYLSAVTGSKNSTWTLAKTNRRPTQTLTVTIMSQKDKNTHIQKTSQQTSCQYIVVDDKSIYKSIFEKEILSEVVAAWAVYYPDSHKWIGRYGLSEIDKPTLKQWGFTESELTEFFEQDEGFRVRFYHDWVHDKYYIAFKGTDIRTSFFGDMTNNALLCAGKFSPYLRKALQIGAVIHQRFPQKILNNVVIVGHSLGGALASGAGIVSQCDTVVFNGLGLTYSTLNETTRKFLNDNTKTNQYIRSRIEECFPVIPNSSFRKYDTSKAKLRYFNTKYDLLNIVASEIYGLESRDDILPSALGVPYFPSDNSKPNQKDKVDQVRNLAKQIDGAVQAHQDDPEQFKVAFHQLLKNSFSKDWTSTTEWLKLFDNVNSKVELYNQFTYALEQHSLDAIVHEILIECNSQSSYCSIPLFIQQQIDNNNSDSNKSDTVISTETPDKDLESCREGLEFLVSFFQGLGDFFQDIEKKEINRQKHIVTVSIEMLYTTNIATIIICLGICFGEYSALLHDCSFDFMDKPKKFWLLRLLTFSGRCCQTSYCGCRDILYLFSGFIFYPFIPIVTNQSPDSTIRIIYYTITVLYFTILCSLYSLRLHDNNKSGFRLLPALILCNLVLNGTALLCICNPNFFITLVFAPWLLLFIVEFFMCNPKYFREYALSSLLNEPGNFSANRYGQSTHKPEKEETTYYRRQTNINV